MMKALFKFGILTITTLLAVGCSPADNADNAPEAPPSISCDALAEYIAINSTLANMREMDPLIAELFKCVSLTSDQARDLLNSYLGSQAETDRILTDIGV